MGRDDDESSDGSVPESESFHMFSISSLSFAKEEIGSGTLQSSGEYFWLLATEGGCSGGGGGGGGSGVADEEAGEAEEEENDADGNWCRQSREGCLIGCDMSATAETQKIEG